MKQCLCEEIKCEFVVKRGLYFRCSKMVCSDDNVKCFNVENGNEDYIPYFINKDVGIINRVALLSFQNSCPNINKLKTIII